MKMMKHWHLLPTARKGEAVPSLCLGTCPCTCRADASFLCTCFRTIKSAALQEFAVLEGVGVSVPVQYTFGKLMLGCGGILIN